MYGSETRNYELTCKLANDINAEIQSIEDIIVFIVTVTYIIEPINDAIARVPSSDLEFCQKNAKQILDSLGEKSVGQLISAWDNLGVKGCLDAERSLVVSEFAKLRANLKSLGAKPAEIEDNIVMTAFVQEFERRLGQKRKNRGGKSLEDVLSFLFNY